MAKILIPAGFKYAKSIENGAMVIGLNGDGTVYEITLSAADAQVLKAALNSGGADRERILVEKFEAGLPSEESE